MGNNFWDHDAAAASNSDIDGIGITGADDVENFDNALRAVAAHMKQFALDSAGENTVAGTADVITITTAQTIVAYNNSLRITFIAGGTNTVAGVTVNVDSLGAKAIKKSVGGTETALAVGDIVDDGLYELIYRPSWASPAGAFQLIDLNALSATAVAYNAAVSGDRIVKADSGGDIGGLRRVGTQYIFVTHAAADRTSDLSFMSFPTTGSGQFGYRNTISGMSQSLECSQAEAEAGTVQTALMTPLRTAQAIDALAGKWTLLSTEATTSGTTIDFTGIPSGVSEIMICFDDVSSATGIGVRIGDAGGIESTGYRHAAANRSTNEVDTTQFNLYNASEVDGIFHLFKGPGNQWFSSYSMITYSDIPSHGGGHKTLSAELDRVQLVGTGFTAGSCSVYYK